MSQEFKDEGIAVNALWPRTSISTAAVNNLLGTINKLIIFYFKWSIIISHNSFKLIFL